LAHLLLLIKVKLIKLNNKVADGEVTIKMYSRK